MAASDDDRARARVLRLLARGSASLSATAREDRVMMSVGDASLVVDRILLKALAREGKVLNAAGSVALAADKATDAVEPVAKRGGSAGPQIGTARMETAEGWQQVTVNLAESPLSQLARFRLRDGSAFVTAAEVAAGERLRLDYTCGRIMPRLGANWEAGVSTGRRGGDGRADLTVSALAARQRVDRALSAVGPELSGVLVDVCCFLKGLELVERERGWPVRSAKVVLKTALGALSRHYNPQAAGRTRSSTLHWGSEDYRPTVP